MNITINYFLGEYNKLVPKWKQITYGETLKNRNLQSTLKKIVNFINKNNLPCSHFIKIIINFYFKKNKRYPTLLNFYNYSSLNVYNTNVNTVSTTPELNRYEKILVLVKKSKNLVLQLDSFDYSKAIKLLNSAAKLDDYFLLAHGYKTGVSKDSLNKWNTDPILQKLVISRINT